MAIKQFDERYSGWGTQTYGGGVAGFDGYTKEEAENKKRNVVRFMAEVKGIKEINVYIERLSNGNYSVINRSTYEV